LSKESLNNKNVIILKARKCEITSKLPIALTVDGERSELFPASIEFKQKMLEVFVPENIYEANK
jgi:diacylglycerol kinase family enzyme